MKKILFLLLVTISSYGQTLQNPTFGNTTTNTLKIKTPATVTSVNFLSTVEADGSIAKIDPVNLPAPSNFYLAGTTTNAGSTKTADIERTGGIKTTVSGVGSAFYGEATGLGYGIYGKSNTGIGGQFFSDTGTALISQINASSVADIFQGQKGVSINYRVTHSGDVTANSYKTPTGTATQTFLANGSILNNPLSGTGTNGYISKWNGTITQSNSLLFETASDIGMGTASPYTLGATFRVFTTNGTDGSGFVSQVNGTTSGRFISTATGTLISEDRNMSIRMFLNGSEKVRLFPSGGVSIGNSTDPGANNLSVTGNSISSSKTITTPPTTSAGTYDILTRNTSTGVVEKVPAPKVYNAVITQTSTGAPTVVVSGINTIGTIVWARSVAGVYVGTLTSAFTNQKTLSFLGAVSSYPSFSYINTTNVNTITINTLNSSGVGTDGMLSNTPVKIEVYP